MTTTMTLARPHAEPATTGPGSSRPRRPRSPVAVGVACLVAGLVGIAVAFFIERETVGNNRATSGDLDPVSDSFLPLDFGNERLYPTGVDDPDYVVSDQFTVKNTNDVDVRFLLSAACANCMDAPSAATRQFNSLYVAIYPALVAPDGSQSAPTTSTPIFEGRLADLRETQIADIGAGMTNGYRVDLWLADDGTEQPQNQTSTWDLVLTTQTLPPGSTTTTTLVPPLQAA